MLLVYNFLNTIFIILVKYINYTLCVCVYVYAYVMLVRVSVD